TAAIWTPKRYLSGLGFLQSVARSRSRAEATARARLRDPTPLGSSARRRAWPWRLIERSSRRASRTVRRIAFARPLVGEECHRWPRLRRGARPTSGRRETDDPCLHVSSSFREAQTWDVTWFDVGVHHDESQRETVRGARRASRPRS